MPKRSNSEFEIVDSHLHFWDVTNSSSFQDVKILGGPAEKFPQYLPEHYFNDMKEASIKVRGGVFVECIPTNGPNELNFVSELISKYDSEVPFALVGRLDLTTSSAKSFLESKKLKMLRGIRQILNHHPDDPNLTWPLVEKSDYMKNNEWLSNYQLLGKCNLSFDGQVNPHQLKDLANLASQHKSVNLVLNHMGCLPLGNEPLTEKNEKVLKQWREGMKALSEQSNAYVKLSFFPFIRDQFDSEKQPEPSVATLLKETIQLFGTDRCMLGSNFPVDKFKGASLSRIFDFAQSVIETEVSSENERHKIYCDNAAKFYKLDISQQDSKRSKQQ